jgi:hypothetical protein
MKSIVSYIIQVSDLSLDKLLDFYFICQKSKQQLFLSQNGKTLRMTRMTELLMFVLTSKEERVLIVVEGQEAHLTMGRLLECIYGPKRSIGQLRLS